jgi:hypothetical protein
MNKLLIILMFITAFSYASLPLDSTVKVKKYKCDLIGTSKIDSKKALRQNRRNLKNEYITNQKIVDKELKKRRKNKKRSKKYPVPKFK